MLESRNIVRPNELKKLVQHSVEHNLPVLVKGKLGSGKTQICQEGAELAIGNRENVIIEAPHMKDVPDYTGLAFAFRGEGGMTADFLPINTIKRMLEATEPTVFIFDELDKAKLTMPAVAQIIWQREISNRRIPECVRFLATCNLPEEQTGSFTIKPHLLDRFFSVLHLKLAEMDWAEYMLKKYKEKAIAIVQFINMRPNYLIEGQNTELALNIEKTPTGRSLENYLKLELSTSEGMKEIEPLLAGCCGDAFHVEYQAFRQMFADLPTFQEIVESPLTAMLPNGTNQIGLRFAVSGMLAHKISIKTAGSVCEYMCRREWQSFASLKRVFMENVKTLHPEVFKSPNFSEWMVDLIN